MFDARLPPPPHRAMPPRLQPPASCARRRLACRLVFALWLAYSGALLGWHAFDAPPAGSCIVR